MKYSLARYWQISPLTDLSVPQDDISFPNPLSNKLPDTLSESEIAEQEWHLMHDIEVDDGFLNYPALDLVIEGVDYHAEVRLNGVALFDCDGSQSVYRKPIKPLLNLGRNRFEILFLEGEDDWLLDDECEELLDCSAAKYDERIGIWREPYIDCLSHLRITGLEAEQVWHYGGGCELVVTIDYDVFKSGLLSASVKFDGLMLTLPLDMRKNSVEAVYQIDAPDIAGEKPHQLRIELDEQVYTLPIIFDPNSPVSSTRVSM